MYLGRLRSSGHLPGRGQLLPSSALRPAAEPVAAGPFRRKLRAGVELQASKQASKQCPRAPSWVILLTFVLFAFHLKFQIPKKGCFQIEINQSINQPILKSINPSSSTCLFICGKENQTTCKFESHTERERTEQNRAEQEA